MTDRKHINALKERLEKLEKAPDFDLTSPFYQALKEKIDNLDKVILK